MSHMYVKKKYFHNCIYISRYIILKYFRKICQYLPVIIIVVIVFLLLSPYDNTVGFLYRILVVVQIAFFIWFLLLEILVEINIRCFCFLLNDRYALILPSFLFTYINIYYWVLAKFFISYIHISLDFLFIYLYPNFYNQLTTNMVERRRHNIHTHYACTYVCFMK